jgi:hypothetical protein
MPRIYKKFEVSRLVYTNCETECFLNFLMEVQKTDYIGTTEMPIRTNNRDVVVESYKLEKEKNPLNLGSHLVSAL